MFKVIHWRGYLRVNKQTGAESVIAKMSKALGEPLTLLTYERYWKIPELAEVRMTSPLDAQKPQEAVFRTLLTAQRIAGPWSVTCHTSDDPRHLQPAAHPGDRMVGPLRVDQLVLGERHRVSAAKKAAAFFKKINFSRSSAFSRSNSRILARSGPETGGCRSS